MKKTLYSKMLLAMALGIGVLVVFHFKLSLAVIWPTNNSWLFQGDWAQHYLSWEMFRTEPWRFPLGTLHSYFYPLTSNIGYTDAIPLLAFFFKLLSPLLPQDFQYIGLWLFSCFVLQAVFGLLLLKALNIKHPVSLFAGTMLFVLSPVLLFRIGHPALCAQWLILASLWVYFGQKPKSYQFILLLLSAFIHPYLTVIVFSFTLAYFVRLWLIDKTLRFGKLIVLSLVAVSIVLASWYVIGYFALPTNDAWETGSDFTIYATNLLGLINPFEYSRFLPSIPLQNIGQREGFAYLGLGISLLIVLIVVTGVIKKIISRTTVSRDWTQFILLLIVALGFTVFALSSRINLADHTILSFDLRAWTHRITDTFRAAGRFIWVLYYIIFAWIFYTLQRFNFTKNWLVFILLTALVVQVVDITPLITGRHFAVDAYQTTLSPRWDTIVEQAKVIVLYPPFQQDNLTPGDYVKFVYLAHRHNLPITTGYLARYDSTAYADYLNVIHTALQSGQPEPGSIYVTTPEQAGEFNNWLSKNLVTELELDGYKVFIPTT